MLRLGGLFTSYVLACQGIQVTIDPDLGTLLLRHTVKWRSALTKLASPSSIATRCVFLYKPL